MREVRSRIASSAPAPSPGIVGDVVLCPAGNPDPVVGLRPVWPTPLSSVVIHKVANPIATAASQLTLLRFILISPSCGGRPTPPATALPAFPVLCDALCRGHPDPTAQSLRIQPGVASDTESRPENQWRLPPSCSSLSSPRKSPFHSLRLSM